MKVIKYNVQACCGKSAVFYKTDRPLVNSHLSELSRLGFKEHENFSKAGILYVDNLDFILTGPLGSDRLQVKCKISNCESKLADLEALLSKLG